ncbi:MAG: helix-turn-helix domain-containing protein, partial [Streptosporangiaceae bacterium]
CGGVLAPWWYGITREIVGLGGAAELMRPRRAICRLCGRTRVLLPDVMLRRRQYRVEVIGAALLLAAGGMPWTRVAAELGVPFETARGWLRRFTRRADLVRAWLLGLLDALADDPWLPAGQAGLAGALGVLAGLYAQLPARWPLVAALSPWQLASRLSRAGLLALAWPPGAINASAPVT